MNNVKLDQNNPNMFPLDLDLLKIYASRWVSALPDVTIEKISLYRYSSNLAKITTKPVSLKYCVVFDIKDEVLRQYPHNVVSIEEILQIKIYPEYPDTTKDDHTSYMASFNQSIYSYLECFHTICDECSYSFLMDAGFIDVYIHPPDEHFKNEWIFLTGCLAKGNQGVMSQEYWILFDAMDREPTQEVNSPEPMAKHSNAQIKNLLTDTGKNTSANFFTMENSDLWHIGFEGKDARIKHVNGLLYIGYLLDPLREPATSISCIELYRVVSGKVPNLTMSENDAIDQDLHLAMSRQSIGTGKERKICSEKYQELQDKLLTANMEEQEDIKEQMDKLKPYLNLKERNFADPNNKKVQTNIKKRLDGAYEAINKAKMKELVKHLKDHIKTDDAYGLRYTGNIDWVITIK